jgi:hypothetical protein
MTQEAGMIKMTDGVLAWRAGTILVLVNLVGAVVYDWLVSRTWVIPQEREAGLAPATMGDAFIWMSIAVPILSCFFVLNGGWGTVVLCYRQWRSGRLWLVAFLVWLIAFAIDYVHH